MTPLTRNNGMQPYQGIGRQSVIKLDLTAPGNFSVAITAVLAQRSLMDVLFMMTIAASHGKLLGKRAMVTVLASARSMGPDQWKPGILGMVKLGIFPAVIAVARCACHTKPALMHVLNCMAIIASCGNALVNLTQVAPYTGHGSMFPQKWKFGGRVIEGSNLVPFADLVASLAALSEIAFVGLSFSVATKASIFRFGPFFAFLMTSNTIDLSVRTYQLVVR
jgi:hypothetical protein